MKHHHRHPQTVSPESATTSAATIACRPFRANDATIALPAARSAWWRSASGFATNVVKTVANRQMIFGVPKILRRFFRHDRKLLSWLSRCGWEAISEYLQTAS
jgi:hypothetical protein